jgi:hypothetical protein
MCGYYAYLYCTIRIQLQWWHSALDIQQYIRQPGQHHSRLNRLYTDVYIQLQ